MKISVVVPLYNEAAGLPEFHQSLKASLTAAKLDDYEIIYCDDGSTDGTAELVKSWHPPDNHLKLVALSRNFGKENALTAGLRLATGQAIITIDGDGQHPVELIPKFIEKWQAGAQVVIGVRANNDQADWLKRLGSRWFYRAYNRATGQKLVPGSTDFRLIDRAVQQEFIKLQETDRIARGLIDWLGFKRQYIKFTAQTRLSGRPSYDRRKLVGLAANTFVSMSPTPLYMFGYLGILITAGAFILGVAVIIEQLLLADPWHWNFSGNAMLGILILFLVGIILMAQGILSLYISHIHNQTKQRPLYVIDYQASAGIKQ